MSEHISYKLVAFVDGKEVDGFELSTDEVDILYDSLTEYTDPHQDEDDNTSSVVMSKFMAMWERPWLQS